MKNIVYILLIFFFYSNLYSSTNSNYGFSRINENINFFIDINSNFNTVIGDFQIKQNYFANSYLPTNSINDNQKLEFIWKKNIFSNFYISSIQRVDYVGNNFSSDLNNNLLNFKVLPGITYKLNKESNDENQIRLNYGYDNHSQINVNSLTPALNFSSQYNTNLDEFYLESNLDYYNTTRTLDRNFNITDAKLNLSRLLNNSALSLTSNYNNLENDFIRLNQDEFQIEDRNETKFNLGLNLSYNIFDNLSNDLSISFNNSTRNNSYRDFNSDNLRSGVFEIRELNSYNLYTKLKYKYDNSYFSISYQNYSELLNNTAKNKYLENISDLESQQNNISLLDYENNYSRIFIDNILNLNYYNRFLTEFFFEINRYDTPSNNENRDRDQLVLRLNQKYEHIFSDYFTLGLELEGRFRHLVYLRSENSINNVKERSLKFSPYYRYRNKKLEMTPEFQIFVNFRSYDYEFLFQSIRSDAQRSLTFRDSLNYHFNSKYRLNLSYIYRYRETGLFSWEEFSQTIFEEKYEYYNNLVFYLQKNKNYYGIGIRYYNLRLNSKRNLGNLGSSSFYLNSISPVVDLGFILQDRTKIVVYGWYEYQKFNNVLRVIPNLKVETQININ